VPCFEEWFERLWKDYFARAEAVELFQHALPGVLACELSCHKLACRKIKEGGSHPRARPENRGKITVVPGVQQLRIYRRARGDHSNYFASDELGGFLRIFGLFTYRDTITFANQFGDVATCCVIRNAAHRHRVSALAMPGGQCDLELFRANHRIIEEELIEIAESKKE
jgi:hypothetical protein